eukprot:scaffold92867_cov23-Tisochrysis_lutea.AAC.1
MQSAGTACRRGGWGNVQKHQPAVMIPGLQQTGLKEHAGLKEQGGLREHAGLRHHAARRIEGLHCSLKDYSQYYSQ